MMPPHYVRKPTMMGTAAMPGGAPPQRVMIQRVPYPTGPGTVTNKRLSQFSSFLKHRTTCHFLSNWSTLTAGYPPGTMAPQQTPQQAQQMQQQMPAGPQYAVRPMPPQYPPIRMSLIFSQLMLVII